MEKESKHKLIHKKRIGFVLMFAVVAIVLLSIIGYSLSFSSNPSINSGSIVYTTNNLTCSWVPSADTTQTNVSWYNGSTLFSNGTVSQNYSVLGSQYTDRDEYWTCQVLLSNGTNVYSQNATVLINNTGPSYPVLTIAGSELYNYYYLYEDTLYSIYINSTDADSDTLIYGRTDTAVYKLCSEPGTYTGLMSCNVSHEVIMQTTNLSAEQQRNHTFRVTAGEEISPGYTSHADYILTLIPVNDKAYFNGSVSSQSINSGANWSVIVRAADEELNYPINFTISSTLDGIAPGLVTITNLSATTANITFSSPTTNTHAGNWTVTVNISDAGRTNVTQMNFSLQINSSNNNPVLTTNFTLLGLQSWTQGNSLQFWLNATDQNANNNLTFSITVPTNTSLRCNITFPWNVTTVNSSYLGATGNVSVSNLTNDYVACRYVDLVVTDNFLGTARQSNFLINITNTNDAPVIYEVGSNGNMSNLSLKKFQRLLYSLNYSDPDLLTYDRNATANLVFYSNDSNFPVNSTSGVVTIYPSDDSFIGNWTVNLTISDGLINYSRTMSIEVRNNSVPFLNLSQNNVTFTQNNVSAINFTVIEYDNDTINLSFGNISSFPNSTYNSSFNLSSHNYVGGINREYWKFNLSIYSNDSGEAAQRELKRRRNDLVGNHLINISFVDSYGAYLDSSSSGILNVTITNENDAPFFDGNRNNVSDSISFPNVVFNRSYSITINATDFDLFLSGVNESLTFNYSQATVGIENISLVMVNNSNNSAVLSFTCVELDNESINLTVTDSGNLNYSQLVSFEVEPRTAAPEFHLIKPYFNSTLNYTVSEFVDSSLYYDNTTSINLSEGTTISFDALVTNDSRAGNYLTFSWYVDEDLETTIINVTPGVNSDLDYYFDYFSSNRTHNVTLVASDYKGSQSEWTWIVNISNINRPPVYCNGSFENLSIEGTTTVSDYMSNRLFVQRFYDPDDDPSNTGEETLSCEDYDVSNLSSLTFEVYETAPCSIAEFSFIGGDLKIVPSLTGVCLLQFIAEDSYGENVTSSDVVQIIVEVAESVGGASVDSSRSGSTVRPEPIIVPVREEVDKPAPIEILSPGTASMYANRTIYTSIKIKNTWTTDVKGITLSAVTNLSSEEGKNLTVSFDNSYFGNLPIGSETEAILEISNYREEGPFEIVVSSRVADPEFNDSTKILISAIEQTTKGDEARVKVTFAKDLLSENSECRELNDLLDRAEGAVKTEDFDEALKLVDGVINGCRYMMQQEEIRRESPSMIRAGFDFARQYTLEIVGGAGLLLILVLIFYAITALKKNLTEK